MPSRHLLTTMAAALSVVITVVLPAAAHASVQQSAAVTGMTSGRLGPTAAALVGLIGMISGALALTRAGGRLSANTGSVAAVVALVAGPAAIILGGLFTATADGGPGTGNGIVAAVIAVALGLISTTLGRRTLARSRRRAD
ncbi:DUF6223 family protein [Nocardia carnea]|uniref:DUF6223 family protein n=1 Tax=Nocardia carnea TaxID=37328 RepID=UPI002454A127|nr:DUF6223 family protein [Nocardia carnea]